MTIGKKFDRVILIKIGYISLSCVLLAIGLTSLSHDDTIKILSSICVFGFAICFPIFIAGSPFVYGSELLTDNGITICGLINQIC